MVNHCRNGAMRFWRLLRSTDYRSASTKPPKTDPVSFFPTVTVALHNISDAVTISYYLVVSDIDSIAIAFPRRRVICGTPLSGQTAGFTTEHMSNVAASFGLRGLKKVK